MKTLLYILSVIILFPSCSSKELEQRAVDAEHNIEIVKKQLTVEKTKNDSLSGILKIITDRGCFIQKDPDYKDVVIWNLPAFQKLQQELKNFDKLTQVPWDIPEYVVASASADDAYHESLKEKKEMLLDFASKNPIEFKKWGIAAIWAYTFNESDEIYDLERNSDLVSRTIGAITEYENPDESKFHSIIDSLSQPYWDKEERFNKEKWEEFKKVNKLQK